MISTGGLLVQGGGDDGPVGGDGGDGDGRQVGIGGGGGDGDGRQVVIGGGGGDGDSGVLHLQPQLGLQARTWKKCL